MDEIIDIGMPEGDQAIEPRQELVMTVRRPDGSNNQVGLRSRLDTQKEIRYFESGGILQYVLNDLVAKAA